MTSPATPAALTVRPIRDIQAALQWQEDSVVRRILDEFGPTMINRRRDADPCAVLGFEVSDQATMLQAA